MALTATGLGSGLNITEIVKVLVDAEKVPKEAIFNKTEDTIDAKVSAIGTLKSQLSKFQDALKKLQDGGALNQRTVTLGNEDFFTATAGKNSLPGSYNIKIEPWHSNTRLPVLLPPMPVPRSVKEASNLRSMARISASMWKPQIRLKILPKK